MASVKVNIIANIIGRFWAAAITILLIPQYIKYLGIESYGLVGFYATLIGTMSVLDMGLSTTLSRELAKQKAGNRSPKDIRDLTFSLELIYWGIGLLICLIIVLASGFITEYWVNAEQLPATTIRNTVTLMGLVILFQWPINLYDGGLRGLEELVLSNTITVIMATLRGAGVIVILKYVSPTLEAFFLWQAALSFMYVFIMRWGLWKKMPFFNQRPKFSRPEVRSIWRFALGMTGISAITFFLAQIDKVVLSKMLLLSDFGYYNLAFTIAFSITLIVGPVALAFFPRFATLVAA